MTKHALARRQFLSWASAFAAGTVLPRATWAQNAPDYRALVCVFLAGGNDSHNMVVPLSQPTYAAYRSARGALALPDGTAQLLPVQTPTGVAYGLNSGLGAIANFWGQRRLAVVANMGPLSAPTTRAQYLAGEVQLPSNLYSHPDQMLQTQAGNATGGGGTGWAGRSADMVRATNTGARLPTAISMAGTAVFTLGQHVQAASLVPGYDLTLDGMQVWPDTAARARARALSEILNVDAGVTLVQASNRVRQDAATLGQALHSGAGAVPLNTLFPGTPLGAQMQQVARIIQMRETMGVRRQVFFCQLGGFDTHSNQSWTHWDLMRQLGDAMAAFYAATNDLGVASQVTTFTQSEFGRTLQPSASGSDHGWGSHHLVLGGAVRGGDIYGTFPNMELGGPNDSGNRGALIPTISLEQFGATLARWFGVANSDLPSVFPNLRAFGASDLGFMG